MSDLIKTLRQEALQDNEDYVEIDYRTKAANLIEQLQARVVELETHLSSYPMQPIAEDEHGTLRFESNPIVDWLATEVSDMNQIAFWAAKNSVPNKYKEQLAQMVGYSVGGYGTLSYVSDESYDRAVSSLPIPPKGE